MAPALISHRRPRPRLFKALPALLALGLAPSVALAQPMPPDLTAPWRGTEVPAGGAADVPVGENLVFCAYDGESGVDTASLSVTVDTGTSTAVYGSGDAELTWVDQDPACVDGVNGAGGAYGLKVTVNPAADLPQGATITVTTAFSDLEGNAAVDSSYQLNTAGTPPPPPDGTPPTVADRSPGPGATGASATGAISFCAYDSASGVDTATLAVVVDDGAPTTYSASVNAANFTASVNDPACASGVDGANPNGVRVTVSPVSALAYATAVTVSPTFQDVAGNGYLDGGWSFTTQAAPDTQAPTRGGESPAPGASSVPLSSPVVFCAYDQGAGVDPATIQVVVDDGTPVTYSASQNAASFTTSPNDPGCAAGVDGTNPRGTRVVVNPPADFPQNTAVTVTTDFADQQGNAFAGAGWSFTTTGGPPPPPDGTPPTVADHSPGPGATGVAATSLVSFCAYDSASGVDTATLSVVLDDGAPTTYSGSQNAGSFGFSVNDPACAAGRDGGNPNGVLVTVTPLSALPYGTAVSATPSFQDLEGNAYVGGGWSFTIQAAPDFDPPTRGSESPAPGATGVALSSTVAFCAYDQGSGIDLATLSVVVNDGSPVTYSSTQNAASFSATANDPACTGGVDGANPRGVRVVVDAPADFPQSATVAVTTSFSDGQGNAFAGSGWSFTTTGGPPPPPDGTPPYRGSESPAPNATSVPVGAAVALCVYDDASGVDLASVAVTLDDGAAVTYSATQNAAYFVVSSNDAACTAGRDGGNGNGTRITVTPVTAFPYSTTVTVAPTFADQRGNLYAGGSYAFTTQDAPDYDAPTVGSQTPGDGATDVPTSSTVVFCAYDLGSGVDTVSLAVDLDDGLGPITYSAGLTPGAFTVSANDPYCSGGQNGADPNGVKVEVVPFTGFPTGATVTVSPTFFDNQSNAYVGGPWSFQTTTGPPPPPDATPPYRATETPAPGESWVVVGTTVELCLYDDASGVDLSTVSVALNHGAGAVTYSPVQNAADFTTVTNDPGCADGRNGSDPYGVRVVVTPVSAFPNDVDVTVTPAFGDLWGNVYAGGSYTFHTELAADNTAPVRSTEAPAPGAESVPLDSSIVFCAYDEGWGVDTTSIEVTVEAGASSTLYSAASTPGSLTISPDDPACSDGFDGSSPNGVRVEVVPLGGLSSDTVVTVTPSFQDLAGNPYAGGPYAFRTLIIIDPKVRFLDPRGSTVIGGTTRVRVHAYYPDGLDATTPVQVSFDNLWDASSRVSLDVEAATLGDTADGTRGVYDLLWDTGVGVLADDGVTFIGAVGNDVDTSATLYVRALGADGRVGSEVRTVSVANVGGQPMGGGTLLRREAGDSLCMSCHDVKTHAASELDTGYGNWGFGCWDCHTAHGGTNLMLVRSQIETPNSGTATIDLRDVSSGVADYGLAELDDGAGGSNGVAPGQGVCEVCHTRTQNPDGSPRFRNTGEGANGHPTSNCVGCHGHDLGFAGGGACDGCHNAPPDTPALGDVHFAHDGTGVVPDAYGAVDANATAGAYGFPCGKCHPSAQGEHMNDGASGSSGDPKVVQVWFDSSAAPAVDQSATVDPAFAAGSVYEEMGPDGKYYRYTAGTCSNVYCHGEFPGGDAANDPMWLTGSQGCGACHGAGAGTPPSGGAHAAHVGTLGLSCTVCHEGVVNDTPEITDRVRHVNGSTDWDLDLARPEVGPSALYAGAALGAATPDGAYGTCSSLYCHSNGTPVTGGAVYQTPGWGGTLAGGCTACHGGDTASGQLIGSGGALGGSTTHPVHVDTYGFACDDCHADTVQARSSNTTLAPGGPHVDGAKNVAFTTFPVDQTGGSWSAGQHTCSATYCHSDGQRTSAPFNSPLVTPDWDAPTPGCATCHDDADPSSTLLSGAHQTHTDTDRYAFACDTCHGQTVSGSATLADRALHVNGTPDFYLTGAPNQADGSVGLGASCSSLYCHSAGNDFTAPFDDARTVSWGDTATCATCHGSTATGGAPSYANGSPKANSHAAHDTYGCSTCHAATVDGAKSIVDPALHVDGAYQVQPAGGQFTATVGSDTTATTCNSVTCHGGGDATWGGTLGCSGCHMGAGEVDNWVYGNGQAARINETEWLTYGHGAAGGYLSGNPGAGFDGETDRGCAYCHDGSVAHDSAGNFFRLANTGLGDNGTCKVCHDAAYAGYDGGGTLAASDGVDVGANHYGAHHGGASGENGGQRCWDCHDPHGDASSGGNDLWYMVQARPWEQVGADGKPVTFAAAVEFRATLDGFDADAVLDADDYVDATVGFCNNCHDAADGVSYYVKGSSGSHNIDPSTTNNRCTDCHTHDNGFQGAGSCDACHGAPPSTPNVGNVHLAHDGTGTPDVYGAVTNASTATTYGFPCGKCHAGNHLDAAGQPYVVDVVFDGTADPELPGASYSAGTAFSETGPGGESFRYTDGTCSNVYCHGEFPGGDTTNDPVFQTGTQACGACHGASGSVPPAGGSHARHVGSAAGQYGYACDLCHESVVDGGGAVIDKSKHVDGAATWDLKRTDARVGNTAVYSGSEAGAKNPPSATYGTCSSVYCHSDGQGGAPQTVPTWGGSLNCGSCHDQAGNTSTLLSAAHFTHTETDGYAFACQTCHGQTVTGSSTIADTSLHADGGPDFRLAGAPNQADGSGSLGTSCSGIYCHSDGADFTAPFTGAKTVTWTDSATCWTCHGTSGTSGAPSYGNGSPKANSHPAHAAYACDDCHASVVAGGTVVDKGLHVSGAYDLQPSGGSVAFSAAAGSPGSPSTCSSISCHGGGNATWGGTLTCSSCHESGSDVDDWDIANGVAAQIDSGEWTSVGHGQYLSGNACLYCHDTGVAHGDTNNPFRLANASSGAPNGNCEICHLTGSTGYLGQDSIKKVGTAHQLAGHDDTHDGGQRCWDCHDPHGDGANIQMMGDILVRDATDAWGLTGTRTAEPVVFTNNATGADYAKVTSPYNGVCNVCHTQNTTDYYRSDWGTDHNQATFCTDCHSHDDNFAGAGSCMGCHGSPKGARRGVTADFTLQSHHVGNGTVEGGAMGGTLTDQDCVVCHAEGDAAAGTTALHTNGIIDLRDADNTGSSYAYDVDSVRASAGAAANWGSGNAVWENQTSTALDPFCLSCHDGNGASGAASFGDAGATASNPFADAIIGNKYDQVDRGAVVDIKSMVTGNPPPQGQFSRHAIRGQSTSRYSAQQIPTAYWEQSQYAWNDTSVMGCADCHTSDGANGTSGNAHGSQSEYLLKDRYGTAQEGSLGNVNYVCYRCHNWDMYDPSGSQLHTGNGSDYTDYTIETGANRIPQGNTGGNLYGTACTNCHGGLGFGTIHGTSQTIPIGQDGGGGTRDAYRFMNGASLRYYDPGTWSGTTATCYTLSSKDSFGGCTKHGRGTGYDRHFTRPLSY